MAKPDNRADNVEHLQKSINHTIANMEEAEEYLNEHAEEISPQERQQIESKKMSAVAKVWTLSVRKSRMKPSISGSPKF